jgi:cytoskeletal protein RodZ
MDLKSVARAVEEEAMPFVQSRQLDKPTRDGPLSIEGAGGPLLTPPTSQHTTEAAKVETIMADEDNTMTDTNTPAVVETPIAQKKQRKPRAKKAAAASASVDAATDAAEKPKRGRKPKSVEGAAPAKRARMKRAPRAVTQAAHAVPAAMDEMADLLQLEEENQRLRKLLAEKLRAENADLRKRLNLD